MMIFPWSISIIINGDKISSGINALIPHPQASAFHRFGQNLADRSEGSVCISKMY